MGTLTFETFEFLKDGIGSLYAAQEIQSKLGITAGVVWYVGFAVPGGVEPSDENDGLGSGSSFKTVQAAVNAMVGGRGDTILVAEGTYVETVALARGKGQATLVGVGGLGSVSIAPSTAGARAVTNNADDVTFINIDTAGNTTADYGLFSTGSRFRSIDCKHEGADTSGAAVGIGPGTVAQIAAGTAGNCGDVQFIRSEFAWTYNGLVFKASDYGYATQVKVVSPWHHNNSNFCVASLDAGGSVNNLDVQDGVFENLEDGTAPAKYVSTGGAADTGVFSGNRFATATNAAAKLAIGAKVMWVANGTEAGWSTARPA